MTEEIASISEQVRLLSERVKSAEEAVNSVAAQTTEVVNDLLACLGMMMTKEETGQLKYAVLKPSDGGAVGALVKIWEALNAIVPKKEENRIVVPGMRTVPIIRNNGKT